MVIIEFGTAGKLDLPRIHNGKVCNLVRPFLLTKKEQFERLVEHHGLSPVEDKYNDNMDLTRNYIRHVMMPHVLKINPGIEKVIKKKYLSGHTSLHFL